MCCTMVFWRAGRSPAPFESALGVSLSSFRTSIGSLVDVRLFRGVPEKQQRTVSIPSRVSRRTGAYLLPFSDEPFFADLFEKLDGDSVALKVQDYSLSQTTLEDVFLTARRTASQDACKYRERFRKGFQSS